MTSEFCAEYMSEPNQYRKQLLSVLNPNKVLACEHLMKYHEARNDKVIIFCDNITALHRYAQLLNRRSIHGGTNQKDRLLYLGQFRTNPIFNTLIISKVGDVALDIPEATVIIQVSSHFGSRRQEAQRLGRILRPKPGQAFQMGFNAHFYTLVSRDTRETKFSTKRAEFLLDIGYYFHVDKDLCDVLAERADRREYYRSELEQLLFVRTAATSREEERERKKKEKKDDNDEDDDVVIIEAPIVEPAPESPALPESALDGFSAPAAKRQKMSMQDLSGAPLSLLYEEFDVGDK